MKVHLICAVAVSLAALCARADEDASTMYEVKTGAAAVKAGAKGKATIEIVPKAGAHVSDQAPLKIELTGKQVSVEKAKLTYADSVSKKQPGQEYAAPKFEVPFSAAAAPGKGELDAKMTF